MDNKDAIKASLALLKKKLHSDSASARSSSASSMLQNSEVNSSSQILAISSHKNRSQLGGIRDANACGSNLKGDIGGRRSLEASNNQGGSANNYDRRNGGSVDLKRNGKSVDSIDQRENEHEQDEIVYMSRPVEEDSEDEVIVNEGRGDTTAAKEVIFEKVLAPAPSVKHSNGDIAVSGGTSSSGSAPMPMWTCKDCNNSCLQITRESRCICGHRLKEHKFTSSSMHSSGGKYCCESKGCKCKSFFYVVAEGAWCIRCRCKHKHTDHDCSSVPYKCQKCSNCSCFDSPWVCNCGHSWAAHVQGLKPTDGASYCDNNSRGGGGGGGEGGGLVDSQAIGRKNFAVRQDGLLAHLNDRR